MNILLEETTEPHACPYLADREATMHYRFVNELAPSEYQELMDAGWRKFGIALFRPVCADCSECRPVRIPVATFQPDRSQRRAWKRNEHLEVRYARPVVDRTRVSLCDRYHASQTERKGWPEKDRGKREYRFTFVNNPLPAVEISLWEADRLQAIVLADVTDTAVSGVYHFYEPEQAKNGIGTACMLHTIELARKMDKRWAYFGYYVAGCQSLAYKTRFKPCELLGVDGVWQPFVACRGPGLTGHLTTEITETTEQADSMKLTILGLS